MQVCFVGSQCDDDSETGDFSFVGGNILRLENTYYNLDQMIFYSVTGFGFRDGAVMILYFPEV